MLVDRTAVATQLEVREVIIFWVVGTIFTGGADNGLINTGVEAHA